MVVSGHRSRLAALLAVCSGALGNAAAVQGQPGEPGERAEAREPPAEPDMVVRGRAWGQLRFEIEIAEEAFYERFNEINSDDLFDVHCYMESRYGSRMQERRCQSNSWREQDANIAGEVVRAMRGQSGGGVQQYQMEQLQMQRRLYDEMRRLALQDAQLRETLVRLGNAQETLAARRGGRAPAPTLEREVSAGDGDLPFGAQRVFQVKIGADPWSHALTQHSFTIAQVTGEIRSIDLDCDEGSERLEYEADVDWTIPSGWNACILRVRAQRDTTFALYEF
jgi:hypothetical protein